MAWFEETSSEDRLIRVEHKPTEIRKLLLGALLLAKGVWKDDLEQKPAGLEVLRPSRRRKKILCIVRSQTDLRNLKVFSM